MIMMTIVDLNDNDNLIMIIIDHFQLFVFAAFNNCLEIHCMLIFNI